jgi:L,D-transpeptidase-like protein
VQAGVLLVSLAGVAPASALAVPQAPGAASSPVSLLRGGAIVRLSDERTYTRWAHPRTTALVRSGASAAAPVVGRLHVNTEDGLPEVYLLLRERTGGAQPWVELRLPGRPNGRTGWVRAGALGPMHLTFWALTVDLRHLVATLHYAGRTVWHARVGVGKASTPTPPGRFWVRELLRVPGHTLYGPYAFGTSDYSVLSDWPHGGVVGIHGTDQPWLIPGRPSHGCIRMRNRDIVYLAEHLPIGAPVRILS